MKTKKMMVTVVMTMILAAVVFSSCTTDVDLCYNPEHPHQAKVKYEFNWGSYEKDIAADDSMYVIADRVINHWKAAMKVSPKDPVRGRFVFNGPATVEDDNNQSGEETPGTTPEIPDEEDVEEVLPGEDDEPIVGGILASPRREIMVSTRAGDPDPTTDPDPDPDPDPNPDPDPKPAVPQTGTLTEFQIRPGDYKFIAFRVNEEEMIYDDVDAYLHDETGEKRLQDIYVIYKTYAKEDKHLRETLVDWQDYNPYAGYIQPRIKPVYYDTLPARRIETGSTVTCKFSPRPVTQHIDIYFNIKKNMEKNVKFKITDVWMEMSGIPRRLNMANGYLDIQYPTAKVMTQAEPLNDTNEKAVQSVHGTIDVPSVVQNGNPDISTGPGILQVIIFTEAEDGSVKKIQGKINLYHTLRNAKLMTVTEDGSHAIRNGSKGVLNIVADIEIKATDIIENKDNTGGIDEWKKCDDRIIIDI